MLNTVIIMGRLTADPELQHTLDGTAYCSVRIAVDRDSKSRDGKRRTDFINAVAWKGSAEFLSKYFQKGRMICVLGRLQSRTYEAKDGTKREATEINISSVYFADSKREDAPRAGGEPYYASASAFTDDDAPPLPY